MPALRDAFTNGREWAGQRTKAAADAQRSASTFQNGAEWVRRILIPVIERGNPDLEPEHVAFQLDLNLDPRSTNHAHADFWLSETALPSGSGLSRDLSDPCNPLLTYAQKPRTEAEEKSCSSQCRTEEAVK
jgi:hypothetical protein